MQTTCETPSHLHAQSPVHGEADTGPVTFPTYRLASGTALHEMLVEADSYAAFGVQFGNPWGDIPTAWTRFMASGMMLDYLASTRTPSEMMSEMLAQPPVGMKDPNEVFLHALSAPDTIVSFFIETDISGQPVRWQGAFDPEVARPRRAGDPTMELKQITGRELLDLTDVPLLR